MTNYFHAMNVFAQFQHTAAAIKKRSGPFCQFALRATFVGAATSYLCLAPGLGAEDLEAIKYNNAKLVVDLGVGLGSQPIPCDLNGDGKPDLLVISGSPTYEGIYYFENTGRRDLKTGAEIFRPGVWLRAADHAVGNTAPSYLPDGGMRLLSPGVEHLDLFTAGSTKVVPLPVAKNVHKTSGRVRGQRWSYVDFDGDGRLDIVVGVGDWGDYGWDNAFDENGRWTNGPLHGFVYFLKNNGTNESPVYAQPTRLQADGRDIDAYGAPSPMFADFRGTGKLDLICGEFLDGLTFYENIGTRKEPKYAAGKRLQFMGKALTMPLQMIQPVAYDWNGDGRIDLVVGQEDGRVAWLENSGKIIETKDRYGKTVRQMPEFLPPQFFRQEADLVKFGVLCAPAIADWDGDGLPDILSGDSAGELGFIKNLGGNPPRWAEPVLLKASGKPIRFMAGYNGSIQGPAEAKWGYTNIGVGDWDGDGLPDILVNSITGRVIWFKNIGTMTHPRLAEAEPIKVTWDGATPKPAWNWWNPENNELVVEWRCTPCVIDLDKDGINDLVTVDHEGYLAWFRQVIRNGERLLLPGQRIFQLQMKGKDQPEILRMNPSTAGSSGRRTYCFTDWDGDGKLDLMVNGHNVNFLHNISTKPGEWLFRDEGPVAKKKLAGHNTTPAVVDWNQDNRPGLLVGAEDGFFYYIANPRSVKQ
ncbi:MAG: FG-GAP repeat domain-containing protein [Chthoniobacteraceae bacterium]